MGDARDASPGATSVVATIVDPMPATAGQHVRDVLEPHIEKVNNKSHHQPMLQAQWLVVSGGAATRVTTQSLHDMGRRGALWNVEVPRTGGTTTPVSGLARRLLR